MPPKNPVEPLESLRILDKTRTFAESGFCCSAKVRVWNKGFPPRKLQLCFSSERSSFSSTKNQKSTDSCQSNPRCGMGLRPAAAPGSGHVTRKFWGKNCHPLVKTPEWSCFVPEWGPAECGAKTACFLRFSDADDGEGGGFKRRHLYQCGKGVSFFLTKPRPKRVNGVFVRWTQELAGFC